MDPEKLSNMLRVTCVSGSQPYSRNGILSILLALGLFFFLAEPYNMWDISSLKVKLLRRVRLFAYSLPTRLL